MHLDDKKKILKMNYRFLILFKTFPGTKGVGKWKNHSFSPSGLVFFFGFLADLLPFLPAECDKTVFTFPWPSVGQQDCSPAQNSLTLV